MIYIGIDPSFRKKGFSIAIIDYSDRTVNFKTFKNGLLDFISWMHSDSPNTGVICIENSNLQDKLFKTHKAKNGGAYLTPQQAKFIPSVPLSRFERDKANRDVGKNQAISQNTVDLCRYFTKFNTYDISPLQKGGKWTELQFLGVLNSEKLTTINLDPSQDEIDALQIALHGKRLSMNPQLKTINQNIKSKKK